MKDILIVEDGLHERERLIRLFEGAKFSVCAAESANEAERLLTIDHFRLAILDIGLGDKSGSHLFEQMRRLPNFPYIIILTGNPSVHLKQRFLDEGAAAYIVKASPAAENEALLESVAALLGTADGEAANGIPLLEFLRLYISPASRELFLDSGNQVPPCPHCSGTDFIVTFSHTTQLPPTVEGKVICSQCQQEMDPKVG